MIKKPNDAKEMARQKALQKQHDAQAEINDRLALERKIARRADPEFQQKLEAARKENYQRWYHSPNQRNDWDWVRAAAKRAIEEQKEVVTDEMTQRQLIASAQESNFQAIIKAAKDYPITSCGMHTPRRNTISDNPTKLNTPEKKRPGHKKSCDSPEEKENTRIETPYVILPGLHF